MIQQLDEFKVVYSRAAGLDIHKGHITATVRVAAMDRDTDAEMKTEEFENLPQGRQELVDWLQQYEVDATVMEGTGVYWVAPYEALEAAGIETRLVHAQHVKQLKGRKTDASDSVWLARVCQYDLANASYVPPQHFRELRLLSRHRRKLIQQRTSVHNRTHKVLDRSGISLGRILSDIYGMNGRMILNGLMAGEDREQILAKLTSHVQQRVARLKDALTRPLSESDRFMLKDLMVEYDELNVRIHEFEVRIQVGLKPWQAILD